MVGIAIINYKTYKKTRECIASIKENTHIPFKIYLLDNASPNESAKTLVEWYAEDPQVELILEQENWGYARGNNICIQHMVKDGCDYGVISNNDILSKNRTIDQLVEDLQKDDRLLLAGPKIYSPVGDFQPSVHLEDYFAKHYILKTSYLSFLVKTEKEETKEAIDRIVNPVEVSWVSGAFFAFSMQNMEKIGNFDPRTFLYFEEAILAEKTKKANLQLLYDPRVSVIHDHAFSTGGGLSIISKIAQGQSERYFLKEYRGKGKAFFGLLKCMRGLEVLWSFGKRKNFKEIQSYFSAMKTER